MVTDSGQMPSYSTIFCAPSWHGDSVEIIAVLMCSDVPESVSIEWFYAIAPGLSGIINT